MSNPFDRLKSALSDRYAIEREIGSGGMATVYLAVDLKHERKVAVKVLRPELAAALGSERFLQEIKIAAQLHHPHILPLHDSGEADGFLYYVMPFEEGQSLRERLAREGELPVSEAVRILRDVVDALTHAHKHNVVHRDIKPDNVMLSGRHALVTDFGVAKAVSEATGRQKLTTEGVALGTPAYMAPEQAAADPHIDHRADIYAVGAVAYELLTGRTPFTGTTQQEVLAAHVMLAPEPPTKYRAAVPPALEQLVLKCLEKKAADRWQSAEDLLHQLEALATPSGGVTPVATQPVISSGTEAAIRRAHPLRVVGISVLAGVGLLALVYALVQALGLPDWVFTGAIGLIAIGIPLMLLTGHHERRRAIERASGRVTLEAAGVERHLTWKRAIFGTAAGFAALALVSLGFALMRSLGIGPAATAVTSGQMDAGDLVILAEFHDQTGDSVLAATVTDAFRIDLAQSPTVRLLSSGDLGEALRLTGREATTPIDEVIARELAVREGAKAVIAGDINRAGTSYVLAARVVLPEDGTIVAAARQTAGGEAQLIDGIDRLSSELREQIGESLRSIRASNPLSRETTTSLEALRYYVQATRIVELERDLDRALPLYEEAIRLDPDFAAAYRKIGTYLYNSGRQPGRRDSALTRAYELRDRISERERYGVTHMYHWVVEADLEASIRVLETWHERYPDAVDWMNNLAVLYDIAWEWDKSLAIRELEFARGRSYPRLFEGLMNLRWSRGDTTGAVQVLETLGERLPEFPDIPYRHIALATDTGDYAGAERRVRELREAQPGDRNTQSSTAFWLAQLARLQGRFAEAWRHEEEQIRIANEQRRPFGAYWPRDRIAWDKPRFLGDTAGAVRTMENAVESLNIDSLPAAERPYLYQAEFYAFAGRPAQARSWLRRYEEEVPESRQRQQRQRINTAGVVAAAEGRPRQWVEANEEAARQHWCLLCTYLNKAQAYDRLGVPDSVLVYYQRFLETRQWYKQNYDAYNLATARKRLGELYEARGDRENAARHYNEFVDLWKNADPELQPQVDDVRRRLAILVGEPRS